MLRRAPVRWDLSNLIEHIKNGPQEGRKLAGMTIYTPARPEGFFSFGSRLHLALAVFRGQADALFWPGDS
jgi:hypothetical protein